MKYLFVITALMITILSNAQSRLGSKAKDIFLEFEEQGIEYSGTKDEMYLVYYFNDNLIIQYYFDKDSICDKVLIQTFNQEMTDFLFDTYETRGYLKTNEGWLPRKNGIIYKIAHQVEKDGTNYFLWY
jgi:hypothetical protein